MGSEREQLARDLATAYHNVMATDDVSPGAYRVTDVVLGRIEAAERRGAERTRERCAHECDDRAVLNDAVEGEVDSATDARTGIVGTAGRHRAIEARECAFAIRALDVPAPATAAGETPARPEE